jgi:hypothetical protein
MDKFADISRSTTNVNSKAAKELLFKTLDPKSSQGGTQMLGDGRESVKAATVPQPRTETTKLPPIQRKHTAGKKDSQGGASRQAGNKSAFGAKSIEMLKSL